MRPDESEFLSQVLERVEDLPEGLRERLLKIIEESPEALEAIEPIEAIKQRADLLRRAIEEGAR